MPSFGTNGLHPGEYINYFSLNVFSGYSASNQFFEIAGISNLNEVETKGLQFAGILNITGGNAHANLSKREIVAEEIAVEHNLQGIQGAGFINIVSNTVRGGQFSGGINVVGGALWGMQVAGVANTVAKYGTGVQIAGLYNISKQRMDGLQLAGLFNYTEGLLIGTQIGIYNSAGRIEGKNSYNNNDFTAVQIGLVNRAKKMNGVQIGLVNLGGTSQGAMIGLINLYRNGNVQNTKGATSFGLINAGDFGNLMVYGDETFVLNYQLNLGNSKNSNITPHSVRRYWYNGLIYGHTPKFINDAGDWSAGYSIGEYFYFPITMTPGMNEYRFISTTAEILHYNYGKSTNEKINPLLKLKVGYGTKFHPKVGFHLFGGISYNILITNSGHESSEKWLESEKNNISSYVKMWPGLFFGIHLH